MSSLPSISTDAPNPRARELFGEFTPDTDSPLSEETQLALFLARQMQQRAAELQTPAERRQQAELTRMMESPGDKATMMQMTDQAFRSRTSARSADQLIHVLDVQGIPRFFSSIDRTLLRGFQSFGDYLPGITMPLVKSQMQHETANVVLPAEEELLEKYLVARQAEGLRMNVNHLGEAVLGEEEAEHRLKGYLAALQRPEIEVISVKISTIYSQISPLARKQTVDILADRLELLYRAAAKGKFERKDGTIVPKFVYLDMEEYRDLHLTAAAFMATLGRPGLEQVQAGIALQAYLPDSFEVQKQLNAWARDRVASGGAPITIRLVKGANMEMERVEASLRGWAQSPYKTKLETDANFNRMLHEAMKKENLPAVRLGIASHNLFTLAYGLVLATRAGAIDQVQFEMLEGMAAHQRRALFELCENLLLYAPACKQEDFINAIGYLVRRLDENTGPDNFLRHAFNITVGSDEWERLEQQFVESVAAMETVSKDPRRVASRERQQPELSNEPLAQSTQNPLDTHAHGSSFANEPDVDWSLLENGKWAREIVAEAKITYSKSPEELHPVIAGETLVGEATKASVDPSRPKIEVARFHEASVAEIDLAIECAKNDPSNWRKRSPRERTEMLHAVADEIARRRGPLMGTMLAEGGKLLPESDPEISEAIDFCRFYGGTVEAFTALPTVVARGRGVVAVVSPWNFPLAIPCGGIAAALAAGNTVILKPASDTVLIAWELCQCFWAAGIPREALQFAPCRGSTAGQHLVTHPGVDAVILTGGTETAERMLAAKPTMRLYAETGGKNATIVTALADRDLAIKNVLHSAFSHSGQKCSATSLLVLEEEVYHDASFRDALADAVESLQVGSAWKLASKVGPLIHPPSGDLELGLKELETGESWLVMPRLKIGGNPHLISPGVKWNLQPGSVTHCTEFFGPLLGIMCARDLPEAINLVNATGFGLTSGIESLDDREHELWKEGIRAGNLYINRPTTGAIVLRQPFGGVGKSSVGPGLKAGGPNYVSQLMEFEAKPGKNQDAPGIDDPLLSKLSEALATIDDLTSQQLEQHLEIVANYQQAAEQEFNRSHDHFQLIGEDNYRRYLPAEGLRIRIHNDDTPTEVLCRIVAARIAGCRSTVSVPENLSASIRGFIEWLDEVTDTWGAQIEFLEESDAMLSDAIAIEQVGRLDYASAERVPDAIRRAAAKHLLTVVDTPPTGEGRLDLLWRITEQSLSHTYHRYGNLGGRTGEIRSEPL